MAKVLAFPLPEKSASDLDRAIAKALATRTRRDLTMSDVRAVREALYLAQQSLVERLCRGGFAHPIAALSSFVLRSSDVMRAVQALDDTERLLVESRGGKASVIDLGAVRAAMAIVQRRVAR
ncbi:MAG: hypothetical protein KF894_29585 [Labilithrix sp.]|nr:hypothetical protein [Labilithrix sp.]